MLLRCIDVFKFRQVQRVRLFSTDHSSLLSSLLSNLNEPAAILRLFLAHSSESSVPTSFLAQRERIRRQSSIFASLPSTTLSADSVALFIRAATLSSQVHDQLTATTMAQSLLYDPRFTAILREATLHFQNADKKRTGNTVVEDEHCRGTGLYLTTPLVCAFSFDALASMANDLSVIVVSGQKMIESTKDPSQSTSSTFPLLKTVTPSTGKQSNVLLSLSLCDELLVKIADASAATIRHYLQNLNNKKTMASDITVSILRLLRSFFRIRVYHSDLWASGVEWLLLLNTADTKTSTSGEKTTTHHSVPLSLSISAKSEAAYLLSHMISTTSESHKDAPDSPFSSSINSLLRSVHMSTINLSTTPLEIGTTTACHLLLSCLSSLNQIDGVVRFLSKVSLLTDKGDTTIDSFLFREWPIETILDISLHLSRCIQTDDKEMYSLSLTTPEETPATILILTALLKESKRRVELLESTPFLSYSIHDNDNMGKGRSEDRMDPVSLRHAEQVKNMYANLCFNVQHDRLAALVHEFGKTTPIFSGSFFQTDHSSISLINKSVPDKVQHLAANQITSLNKDPLSLNVDWPTSQLTTPSSYYRKSLIPMDEKDEEPTPLLILSLVQLAAPLAAAHQSLSSIVSRQAYLHHRDLLSQAASDTLHVSGLLAVSHALLGLSSAKVEAALLHAFSQAGVPHRALFSALARRVVARSSDFGGRRLKHLTLTELTNTLVAFALAWEFDQDAFAVLLREIDIKIKSRNQIKSTSTPLISPSVSRSLTFAAAPDFEWGRGRDLDLDEAKSASESTDDPDEVIAHYLSFISFTVASLTPFSRFVNKYTPLFLSHKYKNETLVNPNARRLISFRTHDPTMACLFSSSSAQNQLRRAVEISAMAISSVGLDPQVWVTGEIPTITSALPCTIPLCIPSLKIAIEFVSPESTIAMPTALRREIERIEEMQEIKRSSITASFILGVSAQQDEGDWARRTLLAANVVPSLHSMWRAAVLTSNGWSVQFVRPSDVIVCDENKGEREPVQPVQEDTTSSTADLIKAIGYYNNMLPLLRN